MAARNAREQEDFGPEPRSIDLREYWLLIRRRWLSVLVLMIAGALLGLGYAYSTGVSYSATSQVLVSPVTQGPLNQTAQVNDLVNMSTEQAVAQSAAVVNRAAAILGVPRSTLQAAAAKRLTVDVPTTSDVLQITWEADSPHAAQSGANAFAKAYLGYRSSYLSSFVNQLNTTLNDQVVSLKGKIKSTEAQLGTASAASQRGLNANLDLLNSQLSTASDQLYSLPTYNTSGGTEIPSALPLSPSGIGRPVIVAIGLILGLLLGVFLAWVRDAFDDRLRDPAQLERRLGVPTLAVLPPDGRPERDGGQSRQAPEISTVAHPDGRAAEAVRALRATLVAMAARRNVRTVLVVGADASVSSSRMAAELGAALAESGRHVLLMAADMRGSTLAQIFDIPSGSGLGDLLIAGGDPETLTRQPKQAAGVALPSAIVKRLSVLPSGSHAAAAISVLDSGSMVKLLQGRRDAYEFVLLDSPPATVVSDIITLATHVDGVIVIAREASTSGRAVVELRRRLDQVGAELIGGVLIAQGRSGRHRSAGSQGAAAPDPRIGRPQPADRLPQGSDRLPQPVVRAVPDGPEPPPPARGSTARRPV